MHLTYTRLTQLMLGNRLAKTILNSIKKDIQANSTLGISSPKLAALYVGDDPASEVYLRKKQEACNYTGIDMDLIKLPENISQKKLHSTIHDLNNDKSTDGIIVQLPLPKHLNPYEATTAVNWSKDVDGFHPYNFGRLALGFNTFMPATVAGIIALIDKELGVAWLSGKNVTIVGRSDHICKPLQLWLQNGPLRQTPGGNATVTLVHEATNQVDLFTHIRKADMVVTATGRNQMWLTGDHVKDGAVIIDVAFNRCVKTGKLHGDCDVEMLMGIASKVTPVPNGVGPLTVAALMQNVLVASTAEHKNLARQSKGRSKKDFIIKNVFRKK